jgi:hypothetical protein
MERATLNGAAIEYEVQGSGEPLLLIHGSIIWVKLRTHGFPGSRASGRPVGRSWG